MSMSNASNLYPAVDGLYTMTPSPSPSPSAHHAAQANANLSTPSDSDGFNEDLIFAHIYALQNAYKSTDIAVKNKALEALPRFISELHHVIKNLKKERAEAQARLVNIAATPKGKALRDAKHGGAGALLIPDKAGVVSDDFQASALTLANLWTILHYLHAPQYLFGTAPPSGWKSDDCDIRFRDSENRKLGNVSELYSIAPANLHSHILCGEDPFKRFFFKSCSDVRATCISRVITAATTVLVDFRDVIDQSIEDEETRTGASLTYLDDAGAVRPMEFGSALFSREVEGRAKIPALKRLIGLSSGTRWADCLFEGGVNVPGKVPFSHSSLITIASIMIYGQKAPGRPKLVFRADSQLAAFKEKHKTSPSLMANASAILRYVMSADKEYNNSGVGASTGIPYAADIEEYKYFLTKNWADPRIQAIVQRWNHRLFPFTAMRGQEEQEDFTAQLESLNLDDSADAMAERFNAVPPEPLQSPPSPTLSYVEPTTSRFQNDAEPEQPPNSGYSQPFGQSATQGVAHAQSPGVEHLSIQSRSSGKSKSRGWNFVDGNADYQEEEYYSGEDDDEGIRRQILQPSDTTPNVRSQLPSQQHRASYQVDMQAPNAYAHQRPQHTAARDPLAPTNAPRAEGINAAPNIPSSFGNAAAARQVWRGAPVSLPQYEAAALPVTTPPSTATPSHPQTSLLHNTFLPVGSGSVAPDMQLTGANAETLPSPPIAHVQADSAQAAPSLTQAQHVLPQRPVRRSTRSTQASVVGEPVPNQVAGIPIARRTRTKRGAPA